MSPREQALYLRFIRRANKLAPELAQELLAAFDAIREALNDAEIIRLIESGQIDQILDDALLDRSFIPLREKLKLAVEKGFKATIVDLPKAGIVNGQIGVSFDYLSPNVIQGVRTLDSRVINTLKEDLRETVRAHVVENGLRKNPRAVARDLRSVIGLAPSQEQIVRNLRAELEAGQFGEAAQRALLDKRFNLESLAKLSEADRARRIDAIVESYRKNYIAFNAESNARTAALDSMKLGQRLTWEDAANRGIVDRALMTKTWRGVLDVRERPEHRDMEGETVLFDNHFSNGEMIPGESTYNCRCTPIYRMRTQSQILAA